MSDISLLKPYGYQKNDSCGYCKASTGNSSYYMQCDKLRHDHYQELMDRGWRRSGTLYYKPDLSRSCCPYYTIRLEAAEFTASREQRKAIHRLNNHVLGPEYKRRLAMLHPQTRQEKKQNRDRFDLRKAVHVAEYGSVARPTSKKTGNPIAPAHKFEVNLEADSSTKEKHQVFLKYQTVIHKDPASRWKEPSFKRFLCSGLDRKIVRSNGKTQKLGSYHQCYRLDGKLVAVAVLDLLPHAVSSVYLFYDPDFGHWDFGKISAAQEIALAIDGGYGYYYMGYYIHSCVKMRYKGTFAPSYLLDPESLEWNLFDNDYRRKLDHRKYVSPSHDRTNPPGTERGESNGTAIVENHDEKNSKDSDQQKAQKQVADDELELDDEDSDNDNVEIPAGSMFEYNIPGVLSKDAVLKLDLAHWKLRVRTSLVDLEDLRGWEDWTLEDSGSIKGIAAELVAATGPKLLQNSAIAIF